VRKPLFAFIVLLLWAGTAPAYVGPGAGLELVGYFFGLVAWVGTVFCAVLLWPVYALLRRLRGDKGKPEKADVAETPPEAQREGSLTAS
jgi:hypothetical protein